MKSTLIGVLLMALSVSLWQPAHAAGNHGSICPKRLHTRTVVEVLQAHLAAISAGNAALVACDYSREAVFVTPNNVIQGGEIEQFWASTFRSAGGPVVVNIHSVTVADNVVLVEYSVSSPNIVVNDGVDTFIVNRGVITAQTARLQ